jgi:hypothetical protein
MRVGYSLHIPILTSIFIGLILFSGDGVSAFAQSAVEPGGDAAGAAAAQNTPDEYAWRLFEFINLPAAPGMAGVPMPGRSIGQFDPDQPTVWETWALASGEGSTQVGSEVFMPDGSQPVAWANLPRAAVATKPLSVDLKVSARFLNRLAPGAPPSLVRTTPAALPGAGSPKLLIGPLNPDQGFEVRMNQAAFEFVTTNTLYNIEGLEAELAKGRAKGDRLFVQFPPAAKEVKANWVPANNPRAISADEMARYHWRKIGAIFYLLTGFHITTKDLKQWFWADFSQEDFETNPGPALPSQDSTTRGSGAPDRGSVDGERKELSGTVWAHYRLRGTQIQFVTSNNDPIIVGNTMIENGFADKSSCMTCHFRAAVGDLGPDGNPQSLSSGDQDLGTPDQSLLGPGNTITFLQNDFEWSAPFRAQHKVGN